MMQFTYRPDNKNGRWPSFPTLHIFSSENQTRTICGKVTRNAEQYKTGDTPPGNVLFTVCEKCCYGQPTLRDKIYMGEWKP